MFEPRVKNGLKFALGAVAAVVAFVWAFAGVDVGSLGRALSTARPEWIGLAVVSVAVSVVSVVARWWCLLDRPPARLAGRATWAVLSSSTLAAQMANIVMPFRLGDSVRLVAASQTLGLGPARAAGSAVLERLGDVLALGMIGTGLVLTGTAPIWARDAIVRSSRIAAIVAVVAVVALAAIAWFGARRIAVLPSAASLRLAMLGTLAVPASSALTNLLVMQAFRLPAPPVAALLLMVVLQVGTSIVTVPGGLGVSQLLTVKTLAIYHVSPADALAFSLVLYAVANLPKLLMLPAAMAWAGRVHAVAEG